MQKYFYCCLLIAALTVLRAFSQETKTNEWGPVTYGTEISIVLKNNEKEIRTNQPVKLLMRYRNVSTNEAFQVFEPHSIASGPDFSFVIISPSGKGVSPKAQKFVNGSGMVVTLLPNQTRDHEFYLSELCELDEIGAYKIIAKILRWSPKDQKKFEVVSNLLSVTVVSDK